MVDGLLLVVDGVLLVVDGVLAVDAVLVAPVLLPVVVGAVISVVPEAALLEPVVLSAVPVTASPDVVVCELSEEVSEDDVPVDEEVLELKMPAVVEATITCPLCDSVRLLERFGVI